MSSTITRVLSYGESQIRTRSDEKVNLTDMWKASGSDQSKRPVEWLRLSSTATFIEHLTDVAKSHVGDLVEKTKGGNERGGATWAHWHLALAYARYLSPAFHVWCNEVVRREMARPVAPQVDASTVLAALSGASLRVGDNAIASADMKAKIGLVASAAAISFQAAHGEVRREFKVASYRHLSLVHYPLAREQLIARAENPRLPPALTAAAATRQLDLFARLNGRAA